MKPCQCSRLKLSWWSHGTQRMAEREKLQTLCRSRWSLIALPPSPCPYTPPCMAPYISNSCLKFRPVSSMSINCCAKYSFSNIIFLKCSGFLVPATWSADTDSSSHWTLCWTFCFWNHSNHFSPARKTPFPSPSESVSYNRLTLPLVTAMLTNGHFCASSSSHTQQGPCHHFQEAVAATYTRNACTPWNNGDHFLYERTVDSFTP